ncbi:MAG TPA: hypothetical protein VE965_03490 [Gammaproteobacteria bacterium]|nr:hypothetical protein [Gammaproteobacteria bacterium]
MADPALHDSVERLPAQDALLVVPRQFAHPVGWDESKTNPSNE